MTETDLIQDMVCKNCASCLAEKGKYFCKERLKAEFVGENGTTKEYEETKLDSTCSFWSKDINAQNKLKGIYLTIVDVLREFIDTREENYTIIALWILGTWIHKSFPTYPYLYINAMKGSGKTRLLKLIKELSKNGDMLASLSEAVLFRTTGTLCIDEFENVNHKDKNTLRELLNTAYKKGGKVKRMRKKKTLDGEEQVVEEFDTFRPIVIANITGIEDVLGDRCISFILEKSDNPIITRKIEQFETHPKIVRLKQEILIWCSLCNVVSLENVYTAWNTYINNTTLTTLSTQTSLTTLTTLELDLFKKIYDTNINGRNLELTFPILILAEKVGILEPVIEIVKQITESKKDEDSFESRDIMLFNFVSNLEINQEYKMKELVNLFRQRIDYDEEDRWLNERWMGRALKRLNLIINRRRLSDGIEVTLNIEKAKKKSEIFK